jgi:hypothetical protein
MRAAILFLIILFASGTAHAADSAAWRITKTEWSAADEEGYSAFVIAIGRSRCNTTASCLRDPANPFRDTDPVNFRFVADCADLPYMLRAYYAWKKGLPFSFVSTVVGGSTADMRYSRVPNRATARRDIVDNGALRAPAVLDELRDTIFTGTMRVDASLDHEVAADHYSPRIARGSIRAGTIIYDVNGHTGVVYDIGPDGRIYYMDAHPDFTLTRSVYGAQFGQSPMHLGGGFKNWRPLRLVGAREESGRYVGGRIVHARNAEIPDFSLEQYRGNTPGAAPANGANARFSYNGAALGHFDYMRAVMSGGNMSYAPVYELQATMATLCNDLKDRALFVNMAISAGIHRRPQPARLPDNIYGTYEMEWETYSTPSRDARIKTAFAAFYRDLARMIQLWQNRDRRISYDGVDLRKDLQDTYAASARACAMTYTKSDGRPVTLDFDQMMRRLFAMSFDPYHCIERRWGVLTREELSSCRDDDEKERWYFAEERLRNQIDRTYEMRMNFDVAQLEAAAPGSGADASPPVDIKWLIDNMGSQRPGDPMRPVGR